MQTSQCLSYRSLQERMEGLEEMKEGEEEEEEIEGNRRDEEEIQDSLVVEEGMMVKFPLNSGGLEGLQALPPPLQGPGGQILGCLHTGLASSSTEVLK